MDETKNQGKHECLPKLFVYDPENKELIYNCVYCSRIIEVSDLKSEQSDKHPYYKTGQNKKSIYNKL